ncbi:GNAT family N-acetyltransferase [Companilactobacillus halodurans]|uniref:GNAT family N-acetyltransferase n=1 Tax=Companilactobacillus halodurans TaxID=2584183 RepID=A0A5P0ZRD6_9LACO|nr:GNAT family N-acetyltransferase [Companilactobacillus halodurans]MQS76441.1 GNAT family N-acetyltransferase [Companilactobacillus halodurans]MQS97538.1 GNAT family N-acetyltransferase [Companilactobacillus halodurans]
MTFKIIKTGKYFDFQKISQLYYQTFIYSYVGLVPQKYLNEITPKTWHPKTYWNNTLIALDGDKVAGVCSYGPARRSNYQNFGEIYTLYVLPKYQHQGIGQKLFQKALNILHSEFSELYLIVLKNNLIARAFYEMFGFEETLDLIVKRTNYGLIREIVYIEN